MPETQQIDEKMGVSAQHELAQEERVDRTQDLTNIPLPFTVEGVTVMSPGVWNGKEYKARQIKEAFRRTDFSDSDVASLFNEHDDEDSRDWIGEVKNVRLEGDEIKADLDIVTADEARKVAYGARFGISPKVTGLNRGGTMHKFGFDNFSLVLDPAVKTTFLNSNQETSDDDVQKVNSTMVKPTMTEEQAEELSDEQREQLSTLVETAENASVEDLAEIASPFMGMEASTLKEHIGGMVSEDEEEDEEYMSAEEVAEQAASKVLEEMSDDEEDAGKDEGEDEAEETMSADEVADKVMSRISEEMGDDEEDESGSEEEETTENSLDTDEIVSKVKDEIMDELSDEEEDESGDGEETTEEHSDKTPNQASEATGQETQELEDKVSQMDSEELDKGAAAYVLRSQKGGLR